jgi:formate dehydrogenase maturation protein FdhE
LRGKKLGIPSTQEQLNIVSTLVHKHENLKDVLKLHHKILKIQSEIDITPKKGTTIDYLDETFIANLMKKSIKAKKPIIHFINQSIFDLNFLPTIFRKTIQVLIEHNFDERGLKTFLSSPEGNNINLLKIMKATLNENITVIREIAEKANIQPSLLLFIVSVFIQPYLRGIARKIDSKMLDKWWQASCPVCGRLPMAARLRDRKRYLVCTFCSTEYLSDRYFCVHCNNKDPYTLNFLINQANPALQIDFCKKCEHYLKVIDEAKLEEPIPRGLEDILTLDLDALAKNKDLIRESDELSTPV